MGIISVQTHTMTDLIITNMPLLTTVTQFDTGQLRYLCREKS